MEERTIKKYTILISSPSDVEKYVKNVQKAIKQYNTEYGLLSGIVFDYKNWKENVYPKYGEQAQDVINRQIVEKSDIVIALFGAKLGTPTKEHQSGTIEEIVKITKLGGKALTFFATGKLIKIEDINPEQLTKLNIFKRDYYGIYNGFASATKLEESVINALKNLSLELKDSNIGDLQLKSYYNNELYSDLMFEGYDFLNSPGVKNIKNEIKTKYDLISSIHFAKKQNKLQNAEGKIELSPKATEKVLGLAKTISSLFQTEAIEISDADKSLIETYLNDNELPICEDFFDIANAYYSIDAIKRYSLSGTDEEIKKVRAIFSITKLIKKYNGVKHFLQFFNDKYFLVLVLENKGKTFCEDIDVVIKFETAFFKEAALIGFTELQSAKILEGFATEYLKPHETINIENMKEGTTPIPTFIPQPVFDINGSSYTSPDLDHYNDKWQAEISNIYPYIKSIDSKNISIKLKIGDLKQFTSTFICGALLFENKIEELYYTITTKSIGRQIQSVLKIKQGE